MGSPNLFDHGIQVLPSALLIPPELFEEAVQAADHVRMSGPPADVPTKSTSGEKPYVTRWLGRRPLYVRDSIWNRLGRTPALWQLAQEYLDAAPTLCYYNVWESRPTPDPPAESQLWHRDYDDARLVKVFLYLTDVTLKTGAMSYIAGTHSRSQKQIPNPEMTPDVSKVLRATDKQMSAVVPKEQWVIAEAPTGTLLVADTTGWHKGGYLTEGTRLVYTALYTKRPGTYFRV